MEHIAKLKRTWNVAPVLQIFQKIPENYCPCLYLSIYQVWWLNELWFRRYTENTPSLMYQYVTDLVNHGVVRNSKTWVAWEWNTIFLLNKILNLCLRWHILRSYHYVAEVTFKDHLWCKKPKKTENHSKYITDIVFNSVAIISTFSIFSVLYFY